MAELEKVTVWREGRACNVNACDLERWIADGWSLDAQPARVDPIEAETPPITPEPKRKRAKGVE